MLDVAHRIICIKHTICMLIFEPALCRARQGFCSEYFVVNVFFLFFQCNYHLLCVIQRLQTDSALTHPKSKQVSLGNFT